MGESANNHHYRLHPMKSRTLFCQNLLPIALCLWLNTDATILAQDSPAIPKRTTGTTGFDIVIADGIFSYNGEETAATLENVIDLLRDRHPEANIVVAPEVPPIRFQSLKIRATELGMELEALRVASGDQFTWEVAGGPIIDPVTGLPAPASEQPLYVLRGTPEAGLGRLRVEAFSLGGYLASVQKSSDPEENERVIGQTLDELEEMVRETVDIYRAISEDVHGRDISRRTSLNIRFHRGANLVILIGDPESVEIAGKVIGALPHVHPSMGGMGFGDFEGGSGGLGEGGGRAGGYGMDPVPPPLYNPYGRPGTGYGGATQGPPADEPPRR
jgi:hypothetical protein